MFLKKKDKVGYNNYKKEAQQEVQRPTDIVDANHFHVALRDKEVEILNIQLWVRMELNIETVLMDTILR